MGKYAKHVRQERVTTPTADDPARKTSVISDGVVAIAIHEGKLKRKDTESRLLRIEYSPFPRGPLDQLVAGDAEFLMFAKTRSESRNEDQLLAGAVPALDTPF